MSDNYAYLVHREGSRRAIVVDASEAEPVRAAAEREGLELEAICATHHHHDHVGGHAELVAANPSLRVFAHASENTRVPCHTDSLRDGDVVSLAGLDVRAIHVPGHTLGALAYVIDDALFTGDTLFLAGCGRLFEGTPEMMLASLEKLASMPDETRVYCGHEYTAKNLAFARSIDPTPAIEARLDEVRRRRDGDQPSVPGRLGDERTTNPFLWARRPHVAARYPGATTPSEVFAALRKEKDAFR